MQGALDLATMAAAADASRAFDTVRRELVAHGIIPAGATKAALLAGTEGQRLTVLTGRYIADAAIAPAARSVSGGVPANAVCAVLDDVGDRLFAQSWSTPPQIRVASVAAAEAEASFALGSRLARVGGGLLASILRGLLGSGVTLDVMSYNRLLGANVTLLGVYQNLAQELSLDTITYDQLFATDMTEGVLARTIGETLAGFERTAMMQIAANISAGANVEMGRVVDLGDWGATTIGTDAPGLGASVGALDLLGIAAALSDGNHQAALNLGAALPGLASLGVRLTVGEPLQSSGWTSVLGTGEIVRNTQLRLQIDATIGGGAMLQSTAIAVPLSLELAPADARIAALTRPSDAAPDGTATIEARPSVARLSLGTVTPGAIQDFGHPLPVAAARMVNVPIPLEITGRA